jgi:hypothetical protein
MKEWLSETIDQIALGECMASSSVSCGPRFGIIAIDNAVEYSLISYVEQYKQLVGGHKPGGINKRDWDKKRRQFPDLLGYVATIETNLAPLESNILRYHDFRNNLYHSGLPLTTNKNRVHSYSELARNVLNILYSISYTSDEWDSILSSVKKQIEGIEDTQFNKFQVSYELIGDTVKFVTTNQPTAQEAIAISIHGYTVLTGDAPSRPLLVQTLARSGHPLSTDVLNSRLSDLRRNKWLRKSELLLSANGRRGLSKRYLL